MIIDRNESDDIGWFTLEEAQNLTTTEDIKQEINLAFKFQAV